MNSHSDWSAVVADIARTSGQSFTLHKVVPVSGGSINTAYRLDGDGRQYFVKINAADRLEMFAAEADGLAEIAAASAMRVPEALVYGADGTNAWLVCEYIAFGARQHRSEEWMGQQLAEMHRHTAAQFGWHRDNTIGATLQRNDRTDNWLEFWREKRLGFQLGLLLERGMGDRLATDVEALGEAMPLFFSGYTPGPSLLHGDLWGGNHGYDEQGQPVIFDPAVYYGDREADLAMTELFGGFGPDFYAAYQATWPLDAGYKQRRMLYNLYHIMNHANLFGGGYLHQAEGMTAQLLAELRQGLSDRHPEKL